MTDAATVPLPAPVRGLRAAFIFLTRIPVGGRDYRAADWRWAAAWFPAVGLCLGVLLALAWSGLGALPPLSRATLVVAAGLLLTGAMHEDGLADTADALGGAVDRAKLFAILKDSRLGSYGVAALCLALLLRVSLLADLGAGAPLGLLLSHTLARLLTVWLMVWLPYVTAEGVAKSRDVAQPGWRQLLVAHLVPAAVVGGGLVQGRIQPAQICTLVLALAGVGGVCAWRFHRRAGGTTGDLLGASEQVTEITVLVVLGLTSLA